MAGLFTPAHLGKLRAEYAGIATVDPDGPTYPKICAMLDGMTQEALKQLAGADIKFLSSLARNRVRK